MPVLNAALTGLCLAVDIGTTWAKLAVYAGSDPEPRHLVRVPSGVGELEGSADSVRRFLGLCEQLEAAVEDCLARYPVARLGLTSIREGLVLLDGNGSPCWVSGNALLDDERMLAVPIGGAVVSTLLPEVLARLPQAATLVSIPGFVASRLTGHSGLTASELSALGLWRTPAAADPRVRELLAAVPLVGVGEPLGTCRRHPETSVYLAGTDEQASHHGAGVGRDGALGLATATFWSLTAPADEVTEVPPAVRYIPAIPPYSASVSVIGYRWGPYLQDVWSGGRPRLPERLPRWAVGEVLECLRGPGPVSQERLIAAAVADIRAALRVLGQVGRVSEHPTLVVHGGGLTGLPELTRAILTQLGLPWVELAGDATQLGCCLAGAETGG